MSDQNPYETLGVTEDASFEEIQDAKNRLSQQYKDDGKLVESVEAAYDTIIMDRLKRRQEGKIKVPERIRFPERSAPPQQPSPKTTPANRYPAWLQGLIDTPSRADILISASVYVLLGAVTLFYQSAEGSILSLVVALGFGASVYLLNRKEKRLGRSVLLTLAGLLVGMGIGAALYPLAGAGLEGDQFATLVTFFVFWLITSFLR
ncbi:MAG: molecular chaperone DnaJ [Cyanobacteria bacterium QS_4_48_99]|nr:MAG: molecular chaperone DnaJ [Cyanobacteria bacterium QS_4_48_99]PSO84648.1 MAG: molecular chaperone DnaJ [Cyanobacteria bacterium QS_5_48_63]